MRAHFYKIASSIICFGVFFFVVFGHASADTLTFSPSAGSYSLGKSFSVSVLVSSASQSINAVSGTVGFPQDKLQVLSVKTSSSIISLWVAQPSFSNSAGTVSFEGIIPNPGFQGSGANVLTINFKVISAGSAPLTFSSASVLANDGYGTNILKHIGSTSFSLGNSAGGAETETPPTASAPAGTPAAPIITSATHPDENFWYAKSNAELSWPNPSGVTATRLLFGRLQNATPTVVYKPPVDSKEITNIEDGIWYFHAQNENAKGWGAVGDFTIRVDTTPPETFVMKEIARSDKTEPKVRLSMSAIDSVSGISYYSIQIDNKDPIKWTDDGMGVYITDSLPPGDHNIVAKAYDAAGNFVTASLDVKVVGIEAPLITEYPQEAKSGDLITVKGTALPNVEVDVFIGKETGNSFDTVISSDSRGDWKAIIDNSLSPGIYKIWAIAKDSRGAKSDPSNSEVVAVSTSFILLIGNYALNALVVLVPILALIFLLIYLVLKGMRALNFMKQDFRKELHGVEYTIDDSFHLLKEDIEDHVRFLEHTKTKRALTREEEALIKRLRTNLGDIEKIIHKKVSDIDKRFS